MSEPLPTDRPRISLEQLLKLKRSERPDGAFWEEFDRELRRRQLASVVAAPTWRQRIARSLLVGLRRAVPATAAVAAGVGGFMVLQRPAAESVVPAIIAVETTTTAQSTATEPMEFSTVAETIALADAAATAEPAAPAFVRAATSEPRFVVNEFAAASTPSRTYVSVTSPNTLSSSAYDASLQTVNTLSSGAARRVSATPAAANF